jgi:flagellar biosynthesis chaperone FliJ
MSEFDFEKNREYLVEKYTNGSCDYFAQAVYELTGWKIFKLSTDGWGFPGNNGETIYPMDFVHSYCCDTNGNYFDVTGVYENEETLIAPYIKIKDDYVGKEINGRFWTTISFKTDLDEERMAATKFRNFSTKSWTKYSTKHTTQKMLKYLEETYYSLIYYYPELIDTEKEITDRFTKLRQILIGQCETRFLELQSKSIATMETQIIGKKTEITSTQNFIQNLTEEIKHKKHVINEKSKKIPESRRAIVVGKWLKNIRDKENEISTCVNSIERIETQIRNIKSEIERMEKMNVNDFLRDT